MIEGRNITKRFGDLVLLQDFSFRIESGEFVAFSGPSGRGKTTLLNIIGLIEPVDEGTLLIHGKEYKSRRQKLEYYRNIVGFLFQNFALIENKTVWQNLNIIKENSRSEYTIEEVLEIVGLEDKIENKVYTLSGGEQQRIALARLFLKKCEIILADEPTGSLDARNAEIVMEILKELNEEQGKTVVMVTHDEKIREMAGRIIAL